MSGNNGATPWPAIARELHLALASAVDPAAVVPWLTVILEARSTKDARARLAEMNIVPVEILDTGPVQGLTVDTLCVGSSDADERDLLADTAPSTSEEEYTQGHPTDPGDSFATHLHGVQTRPRDKARPIPIYLPAGGPNTSRSAREATIRAVHVRRTEGHDVRLVTKKELGPKGKALADEFRDMVTGDYGKRCQICSRTFTTRRGRWQVNVVHVVPPRIDLRTNHFGNLLGLCGWHYNLLRHGQWALLEPKSNLPLDDVDGSAGWERMQSFILTREPDTGDLGNPFVGLPVRFYNIYQDWKAEPAPIDEEIRYSIPHWEYLCRRLQV